MKCKRCKVEKPLNDKRRCSGCEEYTAQYYQKNREKEIARAQKSIKKRGRAQINEYKKEHHRKYPLSVIIINARQRAKQKNIPFDICADDLPIPQFCPILGIELGVNDNHAKANSISIDRIIPEKGYVKGNVAIISYKANTIKNNATIEDLEKVVNWLKQNTSSFQT